MHGVSLRIESRQIELKRWIKRYTYWICSYRYCR